MGIIEVEHLTQDYGHNRGVFDVSLSVDKGQVFGFLGPNGAGKSTTIRHIMGFSKPQSGSVKVFGMESFSNYFKILKNVGYLPGEIALPEGLTGWEFIKMMSDLRGVENKELLDKLLNMFKLDPAIETKKMSLGDKRKLAIVTAFMGDPDVLILDEPTSGLDPVMQQIFVDYVKEEKKRGKTILLSSHMFNEVEATCDIISIIKDGKIVSTFKASNIKHNKNKTFEIIFKSKISYDNALKKFASKKGNKNVNSIKIISKDDKTKTLCFAVNDADINEFVDEISDFSFKSFKENKFTIEDYFMQFYREEKDFGGINGRNN